MLGAELRWSVPPMPEGRKQLYGRWGKGKSSWCGFNVQLPDALRHDLLQFVKMLLIDGAGLAVMLLAQGSRHAHHLAHATAGAHDPDRAERFMRHADVAASHEEVGDV